VTVQKTGGGTDTVETGTYKNKTGKPICDFVVGPLPGGGSGTVRGVTVSGASGFKFDDNADGNVQDEGTTTDDSGESNTTDDDETYSSTGRSISDNQCIAENGEFSLTVTINSESSVDMRLQATGRGTWTGDAGNQMNVLASVTGGAPTHVASIHNPYGMFGVLALGRNEGTSPIESISFSPPSGVTITGVWAEDHPGTFNPTTKVFTFATPVALAQVFGLNIEVGSLSPGDSTVLEWTATFEE